jgi:hypothetical protein
MNITQVPISKLTDEAWNIDAAMVAHGIAAAKRHNERTHNGRRCMKPEHLGMGFHMKTACE